MNELLSVINFIAAQPWVAVLPLLGLGFLDANLGVLLHVVKLHESFTWERYADWLENSVGVKTLAVVALTGLVVLLSQGSAAALATLIALAAVSGTAYARVLADVLQKLFQLLGSK